MKNKYTLLVAVYVLIGATPMLASGPSFRPDLKIDGSSLNGWHTFGRADWRVEKGEIVGTPKDAGAGGWLVLDHAYQDSGLYAEYRCGSGCVTGVLFRAEKTSDGGLKGTYVELSDPDLPAYDVTIDAQGKILERSKLRRGGGLVRVAPPAAANPQAQGGGGFRRGGPTVPLPFQPDDTKMRANDWNQVEVFLDANIIRTFLNNGHEIGAVSEEAYGPIALYAGGSGEVRFKSVALVDIGLKVREPEEVSRDFRKQRLSDFYYGWGSAAADFNHDGVLDVVSGAYIYYGPDYLKSREIYLGQSSSPPLSLLPMTRWSLHRTLLETAGPTSSRSCSEAGPVSNCTLIQKERDGAGTSTRWSKPSRVKSPSCATSTVMASPNWCIPAKDTFVTPSPTLPIPPDPGSFITCQRRATEPDTGSVWATSTAMVEWTSLAPTDGGSNHRRAAIRKAGPTIQRSSLAMVEA
jgi:hypothetical protein